MEQEFFKSLDVSYQTTHFQGMKDYYRILKLNTGNRDRISFETIRKKYHVACLSCPKGEKGEKQLEAIAEAYGTLGDKEKRKAYHQEWDAYQADQLAKRRELQERYGKADFPPVTLRQAVWNLWRDARNGYTYKFVDLFARGWKDPRHPEFMNSALCLLSGTEEMLDLKKLGDKKDQSRYVSYPAIDQIVAQRLPLHEGISKTIVSEYGLKINGKKVNVQTLRSPKEIAEAAQQIPMGNFRKLFIHNQTLVAMIRNERDSKEFSQNPEEQRKMMKRQAGWGAHSASRLLDREMHFIR